MRARATSLVNLVTTLVLVWPTVGGANWDWTVSAESDAEARCVATDAAGNVYVAGEFQMELSLGELTLTSVNGTGDVFLIKLSPDGQVIWGKSAGGWRSERAFGVVCDPTGRVYITGDFASNDITFDTITLQNNYQTPYIDLSTRDVFTACYNEEGNILWARKAGGLWHDDVREIVHDGAGSVYIVGTFLSSEMVFDTVSVANSGNVDLFLAKYDENGDVEWARSALGTGQENAWSLAVGSDDMVYIAGSYRSSTLTVGGHVLTNTSDNFDLYLAKCDPGGSTVWARSAYGQEWDDATALVIDQWDNVFIAGHFDSDTLSFESTNLILSNNENSNIDMYLARLDGDGQLTWATSSTGAAWSYPHSVCAWSTNRVAVTGSFTGTGFGDTENFGSRPITTHGSYDIFLVSYDIDGTPLFAENYGGTDMDFGQDVYQDNEGNLLLAAFFSSDSLVIDQDTLRNDFYNKMLVAKRLNPDVTSVPGNEPGNGPFAHSITLFNTPNPFNAQTKITYEMEDRGHVSLEVFDLRGRLIRTLVNRVQSTGRHMVVWDGRDARSSAVASGVYLFRLTTKTHNGLGKMILIK